MKYGHFGIKIKSVGQSVRPPAAIYKNYSLIFYLIFIFKLVKAFSLPYAKTLMSLLYSVSSLHKYSLNSIQRHGSVVVSTSAWHAAWHATGQGFDSRTRHVSLLG